MNQPSLAPFVAPPHVPLIQLYEDWLREHRGLVFRDFAELRRWSVGDPEAFWGSVWEHGAFASPTPFQAALADARMPGARWFPGAQVNYAQRVLRHVDAAAAAGVPAIVSDDEAGRARKLGWPDLRGQVAALALTLRERGVQRGDRVVAYLPNLPETIVAFLACASIGAIWSVCAPDMGLQAVADRFRQVEPKVLIATDGVYYAGKAQDRGEVVNVLRASLPTVAWTLLLRSPHAKVPVLQAEVDFEAAAARRDAAVHAFQPEWLPFDHPLWVVYSSGTTGLPKALVHGHGGVMLMGAAGRLHNDTGCSYAPNSFGERFHWYSSTGWIMWNAQAAGLLDGTTICLFDGSPGGSREQPDWGVLWRFAARHRVTWFGAGAAFYANCMKAGVDLARCGDLGRIRALGSTGSPLAEDVQQWMSRQFAALGTPDVWWNNISGGTDFAGAFLAGHRNLPQQPGRMQCRQLGCAVEAWNEHGQPVAGEVGELVCRLPLPSMPLYLWGDVDHERYRSSYFDVWPGAWRHGDWLKVMDDESCVIYGRSDATINRHGLRMGTSELYAAVEALPQVQDSLVVDLEYLGRESRLLMFVVLQPGVELADMLGPLREAIKQAVSPRFVPDEIHLAPAIPRTLSGKKQEVPVRKLFLGVPVDKAVNRDAMANPECLAWYLALAQSASRGEGA